MSPERVSDVGLLMAAIDTARAAATRVAADVDVAGSGVILHAAAAASKAQSEVAILGGRPLGLHLREEDIYIGR